MAHVCVCVNTEFSSIVHNPILVVGIWSDLLGDIQWWESALLWGPPSGTAQDVEEWIQNGET